MRIICLLVATGTTLFMSCQSSKDKKEAERQTIEFFKFLKLEKEKEAGQLYSGFKNFSTFYKSDSVYIKNIAFQRERIVVIAHNVFTNGFGKRNEQDIDMIFRKDSLGKIRLVDSRGLTEFEDKDEYKYGRQTGCITDADSTDQQILVAIDKASTMLVDKATDLYFEIKNKINVVTWNWESGYGGSASGKGIVRNESTYSIPGLKYEISFRDKSGGQVTSEEGYVTYDVIKAGESRSFSFYSSYVGNASNASINFKFDVKAITDYLINESWTGKECDEYFKANPYKLTH
jgi:hypothetical protein